MTTQREQSCPDSVAAWEDLYGADPGATPFQAPAWIGSWCRAYAPDRVRTVAVRGGRHGGEIARVVLVPEMRRGIRVLRPAGGNLADFTDVLLDASAPDAARALAEALVAGADWDVLDFPEVPPGGGVHRLRYVWPGRSLVTDSSVCPELVPAPFADFLAALPGDRRRHLAYRVRSLARAGIEDVRVTQPAAVAVSATRLLRLHDLQWAGRPMNPEHRTVAFRRHFVASARDLAARGQAVVIDYRQAGELVASALNLVGNNVLGGYLYGYHPRLRTGLDIGTMFTRSALELAYELGLPRFSQLRGVEPAKLKWGPTLRSNHRVVLVHPRSLRGRSYVAAVTLRHRVAAAAHRSR